MNAQLKAQRAYASASTPTRTLRGTEYEAVARITHRMKSAEARGTEGFRALAEALHDNKKMWSIFAIEVADKGNPLPVRIFCS